MKPHLGIDASVYQGATGMSFARFNELSQAGVEFGIFRASIGTATDRSFHTNIERALKEDWFVGAYHFLATTNPVMEAQVFARQVKKADVHLCVLDVEENSMNRRFVRQFVKEFRALCPDRALWLYTSKWKWYTITGNMDADEMFDGLWNAYWTERGTRGVEELPSLQPVPAYGGFNRNESPLWQFGMLRTGTKTIDGNAFYGTHDEMAEVFEGKKRVPMQERPFYIDTYNEVLSRAIVNIHSQKAGPKPAEQAGLAAAQDDAILALQQLKLRHPSD